MRKKKLEIKTACCYAAASARVCSELAAALCGPPSNRRKWIPFRSALTLGVAYRLGTVAPGLGHLVHMPSHIFFNLGDYEMAAHVNEQASVAEGRYMQLASPGDTTYTLMCYTHDLHFVARSRAEQGLCGPAMVYANKTSARIASVQDQWPMFSDYYLPVPLLTLLRCHQWDEVLRLPEPRPSRLVGIALWHFGRAMALAGKADVESGRGEQRIFEQLFAPPARHHVDVQPW